MRFQTARIVVRAVFVLAVLGAASAKADVVFNNFGAGDTFSVVGRIVQGESVGTIGNVDQAASFTVAGGPFIVTSVSLGIGSTASGPVDVILASDSAGSPGATLKTYSLNVTSGPDQVLTGSGGADLQLNTGATYWVIMDGKTTFDGAWRYNSIGDTGLTAGRTNNGPWNLRPQDNMYAFRVEGRLVPEPGSLALLGAALLGVVRWGRRRSGRRSTL